MKPELNPLPAWGSVRIKGHYSRDKLIYFEDRPNVIIRRLDISCSILPPFSVEAGLARMVRARALFRELTDDYGIANVGFNVAIYAQTENGGGLGVIIASQKMSHERGLKKSNDYKEAGVELVEKLHNYLNVKLGKDEPILFDIFRRQQYMFDSSNREFVLVDVDPFYVRNPEIHSAFARASLFDLGRDFLSKQEYEQRFGPIPSYYESTGV